MIIVMEIFIRLIVIAMYALVIATIYTDWKN